MQYILVVLVADVEVLLKEIMNEARSLTQAERCSLFLLDKPRKCLIAKVFDGPIISNPSTGKEVRIPINQGIAGHVAVTGQLLNINDAYSHKLFYPDVDKRTGFKTRYMVYSQAFECFDIFPIVFVDDLYIDIYNKPELTLLTNNFRRRNILCIPIKNGDEVLGVVELCNKVNADWFSVVDEDLATSFAATCGIGLLQSLMFKKVNDAQHRSHLSNELMMYHMKVSLVLLIGFLRCAI